MRLFLGIILIQLLVLSVPAAIHAEDAQTAEQAAYYQCSMHPWIVSDKPGNCPICGMTLTLAKTGTAGDKGQVIDGRVPIVLDSARRQTIGVTSAEVKIRPLIYTVHSVGHVAFNPDISTILMEYQEAFDTYRRLKSRPTELIRMRAQELLELARLKLRLAGFSAEQLQQVENAGFESKLFYNFFVPDDYKLPDGSVWIDTDLYEPESELVKPGDKVRVAAPALPGLSFEGIVRIAEPVLNELPRRLRVRMETLDGGKLKPGMAVDIETRISLGNKLSIPETALLDSGSSRIVFVDHEEHLSPHPVNVGVLADGYYEVLSGLEAGQRVASSANFLIDSESRLQAAAQGFARAGSGSTEGEPAAAHKHG